MKLLVLDNYDSFTWNLVHYAEDILQQEVEVRRNDAIGLDEINAYTHIILSPGPGLPKDAGIMPQLIQKYATSKNILGICLGQQAIAENFGGKLYNLEKVYHGISTKVKLDQEHFLFNDMPPVIEAGRYHSWAVEKTCLPECFKIIAEDENGVIMGLQHKQYALAGVQFHPESILTPHGYTMMKNWIRQTL